MDEGNNKLVRGVALFWYHSQINIIIKQKSLFMYFLSLYFWHLWPLLRLQRWKIQISFCSLCFVLNKPEEVLNCCTFSSAKTQTWNIPFCAANVLVCKNVPGLSSGYHQWLASCYFPFSFWLRHHGVRALVRWWVVCCWNAAELAAEGLLELSFCRCLSANAKGHVPPSLTTLVKQENPLEPNPVTHSKAAAKIKQITNLIYERARLIQCGRFNCIINTHYIFRLMWPLSASPWKSRLLTVVGQTAN